MSYSLTDTQLENLECCVLTKAALVASKSAEGRLTPEYINKIALMNYQVKFLRRYIPPGTLLTEGYVSDALIDFASVMTGVLVGQITVDDELIGIIPEGTYASVQAVVTAVVTVINAMTGTTGFTAVDNGDETVTITAPAGSGNALNDSEVNIIINPTWELSGSVNQGTGFIPRGATYIDDPTHALYGHLFVTCSTAVSSNYKVMVIYNGVLVATITDGLAGVPYGITVNYANTYITIGTANFGNTYVRDKNFPVFSSIATISGFSGGGLYGVYNPFNQCTYFKANANFLHKVSVANVRTSITGGVGTVAIDMTGGNVWVTSGTNILIIDPNTNLTLVTIPNAGATYGNMRYYPGDGTVSSERMMVCMTVAAVNFIRLYNLDGTVATATFYTSAGTLLDVLYSPTYNNYFASTTTGVLVLDSTGTLKQTLTPGAYQLLEDTKYSKIIGVVFGSVSADPQVNIYAYTSDGEQVLTETMTNGVPNTYMTDALQCVSESDAVKLVEYLKSECGCEDCGTGDTASGSVVPPSPTTWNIYYGNSVETTMTEAEALAELSVVSSQTYAGVYAIGALSSAYKYICIPTALGTPSSFTDTSTGFPIALQTSYTITIEFISYTVYRSYNSLAGAVSITVAV